MLFIVVSIRYVKYGPVPDSAESLACIYAALTSLCIAGYIQSIMPKSVPFLLVMLAIASIIYVVLLRGASGVLQSRSFSVTPCLLSPL